MRPLPSRRVTAKAVAASLVRFRAAYAYTLPAMVGMLLLVFFPFFYDYAAADAAYGFQTRYVFNPQFDLGLIVNYNNDIEIDATDLNLDNGRDIRTAPRKGSLHAQTHPPLD